MSWDYTWVENQHWPVFISKTSCMLKLLEETLDWDQEELYLTQNGNLQDLLLSSCVRLAGTWRIHEGSCEVVWVFWANLGHAGDHKWKCKEDKRTFWLLDTQVLRRRDYCSFESIEDVVSSLLLSIPLYFSFPLYVYSFSLHLTLVLLFMKQIIWFFFS